MALNIATLTNLARTGLGTIANYTSLARNTIGKVVGFADLARDNIENISNLARANIGNVANIAKATVGNIPGVANVANLAKNAKATVANFTNIRFSFPNIFFTRILYGVVASLAIFVASWDFLDRAGDRIRSQVQYRFGAQTFDFVIVGGGTAGSVLAARLAENPAWKILVLESGGEPHPFQSIPAFASYMLNHRQIDHNFQTVPQRKACAAHVNQQANWHAGRGLGGSSNSNFMAYLRGTPQDYNHWANFTGDPQWAYEAVLPYFKKIEDFKGMWAGMDHHGKKGPLKIAQPHYTGLAAQFVAAGVELGYPHADLNGIVSEGFDTLYYPSKRGQRHTAFKAYLRRARRKRNLTVYKFSNVNKILMRGSDNQVYGVEYERHGKMRTAMATKEVIITAGAVNSPKILMLSGIGPKNHLTTLGIPLLQNLPVGQNLQDHLSTFVGPFVIQDPRKTVLIDRDITKKSFIRYGLRGRGVLTSTGLQAAAYLTSPPVKAAGFGDWPDIQLTLSGQAVSAGTAKELASVYNVQPDVLATFLEPTVGADSFYILPSVGRPQGRGEVTLADADPKTPAVVNPRYLENDEDFLTLLQGVRYAVQVGEKSETFSAMGSKLTLSVFPGCESAIYRSEAYWECVIRSFSISRHNYVGTCPMGKRGSAGGVVDTELRVFGTKGLRVMDASVMPFIPVSDTQAAVMMIAEKGADLVKASWMDAVDLAGIKEASAGAAADDDLEPFKLMSSSSDKAKNPTSEYGAPNKGLSDDGIMKLPDFMVSLRNANQIFGIPENLDTPIPEMMKKAKSALDIFGVPDFEAMKVVEVKKKAKSALDIFGVSGIEDMTIPEMMVSLKSANDIFGVPEDQGISVPELMKKMKSANEIFGIPDLEKMTVAEVKEKAKSALDIFGVSPDVDAMPVEEAVVKLKSALDIFGVVDAEPDTKMTVGDMMSSLKSANDIFGVSPSDISIIMQKLNATAQKESADEAPEGGDNGISFRLGFRSSKSEKAPVSENSISSNETVEGVTETPTEMPELLEDVEVTTQRIEDTKQEEDSKTEAPEVSNVKSDNSTDSAPTVEKDEDSKLPLSSDQKEEVAFFSDTPSQILTPPSIFSVLESFKNTQALTGVPGISNISTLNFADFLGNIEPIQTSNNNEVSPDEEAVAIKKDVASLVEQFGPIPEFKPLPLDDSFTFADEILNNATEAPSTGISVPLGITNPFLNFFTNNATIRIPLGSNIIPTGSETEAKQTAQSVAAPSKAPSTNNNSTTNDDDDDDIRDQNVQSLLNMDGAQTLSNLFSSLRPALSILGGGDDSESGGLSNLNFFEDFELPGLKSVRSTMMELLGVEKGGSGVEGTEFHRSLSNKNKKGPTPIFYYKESKSPMI